MIDAHQASMKKVTAKHDERNEPDADHQIAEAPPRSHFLKRLVGLPAWIGKRYKELLSIDLRALAAFRIGMALLILVDLYNRAPDIYAHYSDDGLLPRSAITGEFLVKWNFSIHMMSGRWEIQAVLFVVAAVFALMLLVGLRTRWAVFLSWFMLASLQSRNPQILNAGDALMRVMMFWAMFLPLGARYSIDRALAAGDPPPQKRVFSVASVALLLQLCFMYVFTAIMKAHPKWIGDWSQVGDALLRLPDAGFGPVREAVVVMWDGGFTALYYALQIDAMATPLGEYLGGFYALTKALTIATILLEFFGPMLLFVPFRITALRTLLVAVFISFHLGIFLTMEVGLFAAICIVCWTVLLPSGFWDRLTTCMCAARKGVPHLYYDHEHTFAKKILFIVRTALALPGTTACLALNQSLTGDSSARSCLLLAVDAEGMHHENYHAVVAAVRSSPIFWWLGPALALPPARWMGRIIFDWAGRHREAAGRIVGFMKFRPMRLRTSRLSHVLVSICLVYVLMWNVRALNFEKYVGFLPRKYNNIGTFLRLDQYWKMFAPHPPSISGWYVIEAEQIGGTKFDLFHWDEMRPVSWEKPERISKMYRTQRWRKYLMNLHQAKHVNNRKHFAKYLCKRWNSTHTGDYRLLNFNIIFMVEKALPEYKNEPHKRLNLLWWQCYKELPETSAPRLDDWLYDDL